LVELIASVLALRHGHLFSTLNYSTPDPACPIRVATDRDLSAGDSFLNVNITPQGQASAVVVRRI
jgi:3-oxoacyl-[acyl-carrier-protein] synthase II